MLDLSIYLPFVYYPGANTYYSQAFFFFFVLYKIKKASSLQRSFPSPNQLKHLTLIPGKQTRLPISGPPVGGNWGGSIARYLYCRDAANHTSWPTHGNPEINHGPPGQTRVSVVEVGARSDDELELLGVGRDSEGKFRGRPSLVFLAQRDVRVKSEFEFHVSLSNWNLIQRLSNEVQNWVYSIFSF